MTERALSDLERVARDTTLEEAAHAIEAMSVTGSDRHSILAFILVRDSCAARIRSLKSTSEAINA